MTSKHKIISVEQKGAGNVVKFENDTLGRDLTLADEMEIEKQLGTPYLEQWVGKTVKL